MVGPLFQLISIKPLEPFLTPSFTFYMQSMRESFWLYLRKISRISPLPLQLPWSEPITGYLGYCSSFSTDLPASVLAPHRLFSNTAVRVIPLKHKYDYVTSMCKIHHWLSSTLHEVKFLTVVYKTLHDLSSLFLLWPHLLFLSPSLILFQPPWIPCSSWNT